MIEVATWLSVIILGIGAPIVFGWFLWELWRNDR